MARFYPLYVRRSDGKLETVGAHRHKEANKPTGEQLNQQPDKNGICDYYRPVSAEELKHLDWRRKLGGMLARKMGFKDHEVGYILADFPENFTLYEHVKKSDDTSKVKLSKNHAGGGNERQDAYLYGHPQGRKKRYRSPADFFPHLLWLCTDESGDSDNCSCKICSPEELERDVNSTVKELKTEAAPKKEDPPGLVVGRDPIVEITRRTNGQDVKSKPSPAVISTARPSAPQTVIATPLPGTRHPDQQVDMQYGTFMYRQGELVWFNKGSAWGLGVILRRYSTSDRQNSQNYIVQPLSHPFRHPPTTTLNSNALLRPFVAWSIPGFTCPVLNSMRMTFETADWHNMANGRYGQGDIEVDGSILAAKAIDATFTPFDLIRSYEPSSGITARHWTGIYLGAEKVWVGDPIRIRAAQQNTDIMVVHNIVEKAEVSSFNGQPLGQTIELVGDTYTLKTVQHGNLNAPVPQAGKDTDLPCRLREDLRIRNSYTVAAKRQANYWQILKPQTRIPLSEFKSRWYEATLLLPFLVAGDYDTVARKGELTDAGFWMNARGDCNSRESALVPSRGQPTDSRKRTRIEAFGQAVPAHTQIVDGSEPPQSEPGDIPLDPQFGMPIQGDGVAETMSEAGGHPGGFEDLMNLDGIDADPLPGFGHEYGGQNAGGHPYY
ncbi:hypothetical protein LTR66_006988 [Elasticomyces elasticus]|nr:hypothetical protein LTR66_006988 [Elasticomyces elasticus]